MPTTEEKVNPSYYQTESGLECIDVIEAFRLDYCKGCAVKYIVRAGKKSGESEEEDLKKALWYIQRRLKQLMPQ